jgi:hypothetical protein
MTLYHVHASVISKGQSPGGATGFAQYITREGQEKSTQMARYITREGCIKDDLVAKGAGALPSWANDSTHFFLMADRYERQNGTVARCYEMALPRELSPDQRLELAADIRTTFFAPSPHAWAIHNPIDADGGEHPHMHLMFSERGPHDGVARSPHQFFRQAARAGQDPAMGGQRKDRSWQGPARLREVRQGIAVLTNAALERAGVAAAVSHTSLRTRGMAREVPMYRRATDQPAVDAQRAVLHRDIHPQENAANLAAWQAQKARETLSDLSREAMIDHVRDTFWLIDQSPAREQERRESIARRIAREHEHTGRPLQGAHTRPAPWQEQGPSGRDRPPPDSRRQRPDEAPHARTKHWEQPLIGNQTSMIYHTPDHKNYGDVHPKNQVKFWTEEAAIKAGYRRAKNDHYGVGTGEAMTVEEARRSQSAEDVATRLRQRVRPPAFLGALARAQALSESEAGAALHVRLYQDKDRDKDRGMSW